MEEIILFGLFIIIYILLSINNKTSFSGGSIENPINSHSISPEDFLRRRLNSFNSNKCTQNNCLQKNSVIYETENLF